MKPSPRSVTHFAPAYPAAYVITRLARVTLVLALIFAATLPSSAGDRPRAQRAVGSVFGWGNFLPDAPSQLSGSSGAVATANSSHYLILKADGSVLARGVNTFGQLGNGTTGPTLETLAPVSGLSDVVAIAAGLFHSIALKSDGTVWTWGRNHFYQLGMEGPDSSTPVRVPGLSGVVAIAAGYSHSLAVKSDGTVWAWGRNDFGQLGVSSPSTSTPAQVSVLSAVVAVAGGEYHSLALESDGTVWAWGANSQGQLGDGTLGDQAAHPTPVQVVDGFGGYLSGVKKIATSSGHNLAVKGDGTVFAWGENNYGQLGNGVGSLDSGTPVQAAGLTGVMDVATGELHSVALKADGTVWTWGWNGYGQLGSGTRDEVPHPTPAQVGGFSGFVAISAGGYSTLALQSEAIGAAWGDNANGYLGNALSGTSSVPTAVDTLTGLAAISAGGFHSVAVRSDGTLWTWGNNGYGEMGIGQGLSGGSTPTQIIMVGRPTVKAVATGEHHTLALTSTGAVYAWGQNENGQTGVGRVDSDGWVRDMPVSYTPIEVIGITAPVVAVAAGAYHSLALDSGGTVWAWGANNWGQLGTPADPPMLPSRSAPAQIPGRWGVGHLSGVVAIAAGGLHSLALKSDGTVWAWGRNADGELGNNQSSPSPMPNPAPVQVVDPSDPSGYLTGVVAIAAGSNFSLALKADGTVRAWGNDGIGQLGNGTAGPSLVPVPVLATDATHYLTGVVAIAAGYAHALALKNTGLLLAWGWNSFGQLGNGATTVEANPTPVHVFGPQAPAAISAGYRHSLALALTATPDPAITGYITITGENKTMTYGGTRPQLTYTSDTVLGLETEPTCVSAGTGASNAGTYAIVCSGAAKAGYFIEYVPGTLTVNPALLTISARDLWKAYGMLLIWGEHGNWPGSYITVGGLRNADTVTSLTLTTAGQPAAAPPGAYPIYPSAAVGTGLTNYDITYSPGTLTVMGALTVTPVNQVMTYGGAVPALTYTVTGLPDGQTLDTGATCVVPGMVAPPVGTHLISCSGAAKVFFGITYDSATLTVNPAPLTIISDNKSMGAGSRMPPLTASYFGFVNGDTAATALSGLPTLTLPTGFDGAPGTYTITVAPVTAPNYSIVSLGGQLTVNANALNLFNNFFVTGDYAAGSTGLRGGPGAITVQTPEGGAVPQGAHILAAFLYWQTVESATSAPASGIQFRGYRVLGAQQLGSDIGFTDGTLTGVLRTYRANVLPYLPVTPPGLGAPVDVSMPADWANGSRLSIGASLVVVYRVLSNEKDGGGNYVVPLKAVVMYDGSWVPPEAAGTIYQNVRGFYEAAPGAGFSATAMSGGATTTLGGPVSGDSVNVSVTSVASGCVIVLSTPVNAGSDGLLASWKAASGYQNARDGSWVALPEVTTVRPPAALPEDLFVQIDYMCSLVKDDGTCDTVNGHSHLPTLEALEGVAQAFENHGINVHFDVGNNYQGEPHIVPLADARGGNIIPEETCTDADPAKPQCVVPNEPGLVGWKLGLGLAKMGPRAPKTCAATGATSACDPRFQPGRKDSYHYALFAHSIATPAWSFWNDNLVSIIVSGNTATITTSVPHGLQDALPNGAPARITIAEAISQPYLNGIYVPAVVNDTQFTISIKNVAGPINSTTDPGLAIYSGKKSSSSGYSDVGGADMVITLGNWKFCLDAQNKLTTACSSDSPQDDSLRVNVQAGTLMHELGHSLGLTHGGTYYQPGTYLAKYEANCKPNYQSVMNYLFQIDLLGPNHNLLDYSGKVLGSIREGLAGDASVLGQAGYSTTSWYSPDPFFGAAGQSPAKRHCDSTPKASNETMYRWDAAASSFTWQANQDVNFDGKHADDLQGYDDWSTYNLRQIGATGSHFVLGGVLLPNGGGILLPNGGGILLPNGGGVLLPDGSVVLPNGAGVLLPNGGGVQLPNGGGVLLAGGEVLLPNGNGVLLPNGGGVLLPDGTVVAAGGAGVQLPNGGGVLLPNGGGVQLPNGGGIILPNGGGILFPNGGGIQLANGGGVLLPNGGGVQLPNGGGILLPNGGGVQLPNGGGILLPNGGGVLLGDGTTVVPVPTGGAGVQLPEGGGILLPNGGGVQLPNGGGIILPNGGGVLLPNGGGVLLPNGGGIQLANGGGVLLPNGGGVLLANGGGVQLPNGGGVLLPNGGGIHLPNGGGVQLPNGGGVQLPNGGGVLLPNGGGVLLANGGGITLPNGGGVSLPNGGGVLLPNGGGIQFPNGGGVLFPNGGGGEMDYETANSFVRPPYGLTKTQTDSGIRLDWQAPNFGVISAYRIYRSDGNVACEVTGNPPPTTCPVTGDTVSTEYRATTIVPDETGQPRASQPSEPAMLNQTITFSALPNKTFGDPDFTVSATASSGLPVSFSAAGNCTVTVTGQTVHLTGAVSCTVTASQGGNSVYHAAQPVAQTINIAKAAQSITFAALESRIFSEVPFTVRATASSGLAVTFGGSGNCSVTPGGTVTMQHYGPCSVTAVQGGDVNYQPAQDVSREFTISAWTIQGFHSPVGMSQNNTPVWNVVKGGSAVPLKFNIYAGSVEQTALSAVNGGSVALYTVSCQPGNAAELAAEIDNTGGTSLRYDGTQFIQNWKMPRTANVCYAVRMTARDGSMITGYFRTK